MHHLGADGDEEGKHEVTGVETPEYTNLPVGLRLVGDSVRCSTRNARSVLTYRCLGAGMECFDAPADVKT